MARVLGLALRGVAALETERTLGAERERRARERLGLLASLRERHRLLEVLLDIQRSISHRKPLSEVLDGGHRGRQRTARRLPGRARARRSAGPRSPDRRRHHRRRRVVGVRARHRRHRGGAGAAPRRASTPALAASVHINGARAGALVAMAPSGAASTTPSSACSTPSPSTRASRSPTRAPSRRWRRPSTTPSPGCPTARSSWTACSTRSTWRPAARPTCACSSSTSTASRPSTTASATPPATSSCAPSPPACRECTRAADTAARFGGDEFAVLLEDDGRGLHPEPSPARIIAAMRRPFDVEGKEVYIGATVGIAHAARRRAGPGRAAAQRRPRDVPRQEGGRQPRRDLRGRRCAPRCWRASSSRPTCATRSSAASCRSSTSPWSSSRPAGPSASRRSRAGRIPTRGPIPPLTFIPVAEEIGLIGAIGRWVLREACRQLAAWRLLAPELVLNVNLSALQLRDDRLAGDVEQALLGLRAAGGGAHAGDHREHAPVRRRGHRGAPAAPQGPRPVDRRRRLRHRLLVAELPQAVPGRRAEDRQELRRRRRLQHGGQRPGAHDRRARPRHAPGHDRRGHRDRASSSSSCACSTASSARATTSPSRWTAPS